MVPLFLGLTAANLLLLLIVFALGLAAIDMEGRPTGAYAYHVAMGIAAGLLAVLAHLSVFTYFMATAKWLAAATDKGNLDPARFVAAAEAGKRRALRLAMSAIVLTMLAMFSGAAADPTVRPWWPGEVHLVLASLAIAANLLAAVLEWGLIRQQGRRMDEALALLNRPAGAAAADRAALP